MTRMPKIYSGISVSPNFSFVFDSLANSPCNQRSSPKPNGLSDTIQSSLKSLEKHCQTATISQSNIEAGHSSRIVCNPAYSTNAFSIKKSYRPKHWNSKQLVPPLERASYLHPSDANETCFKRSASISHAPAITRKAANTALVSAFRSDLYESSGEVKTNEMTRFQVSWSICIKLG